MSSSHLQPHPTCALTTPATPTPLAPRAALVSTLDRGTVRAALARMTLHDHFTAMVSRCTAQRRQRLGLGLGWCRLVGAWVLCGLGLPGLSAVFSNAIHRLLALNKLSTSKPNPAYFTSLYTQPDPPMHAIYQHPSLPTPTPNPTTCTPPGHSGGRV